MATNPQEYLDKKALLQEDTLKEKIKGLDEMALLEGVINQIGGLLALSFGQAGSNIITTNLRNEGEFTTRIVGKRFFGIFGRVRI